MIRPDDETTYGDRVVIRGDAESEPADTYADDVAEDELSGGYMSGEPGSDYVAGTADAATGDDLGTEEMLDEIAQTRSEMSATIDEIQQRLQPSTLTEQAKETIVEHATEMKDQMVEQAKDMVYDATIGKAERMVYDARDNAREAGSSLLDKIMDNPIPAAMIGIGLGWLLMNGRGGSSGSGPSWRSSDGRRVYPQEGTPFSRPGSGSSGRRPMRSDYRWDYRDEPRSGYDRDWRTARGMGSRYPDQGQGMVGQVQDQAGRVVGQAQDQAERVVGQAQDVASQAQDAAGRMVDQAQDTVGDWADTAQDRVRWAGSSFERMMEDSPLAIGAVAVGLGIAVGLAVPGTRAEDELLGEWRDTAVEQAQDMAQNLGQKAQRVVQEAGHAATDAAKDEAQQQHLTPR